MQQNDAKTFPELLKEQREALQLYSHAYSKDKASRHVLEEKELVAGMLREESETSFNLENASELNAIFGDDGLTEFDEHHQVDRGAFRAFSTKRGINYGSNGSQEREAAAKLAEFRKNMTEDDREKMRAMMQDIADVPAANDDASEPQTKKKGARQARKAQPAPYAVSASWTPSEDAVFLQVAQVLGCNAELIARFLPHKTAAHVRAHLNHYRRKNAAELLKAREIDPALQEKLQGMTFVRKAPQAQEIGDFMGELELEFQQNQQAPPDANLDFDDILDTVV